MNLIEIAENINERRQLFDWDVSINCESIKLLKLVAGSTVGEHYHLAKDELFVLVSGSIKNIRLDEEVVGDLTSPAAWLVKAGVYHSYHCEEEVIMMCLSTKKYNAKDDHK